MYICYKTLMKGERREPEARITYTLQPDGENGRDCGKDALARGDNWRSGLFFKKLFFAVNQRVDVVGRQLEAMTVSDGIRGARFHAISAKNAARVIDVIYASVTLPRGDAFSVGILRRLNINAVCRAGRGAEKTTDALFETIFIAMQDVNPAVAGLKADGLVRVVFRDRLAKHIAEGHAEALHQRAKSLAYFP